MVDPTDFDLISIMCGCFHPRSLFRVCSSYVVALIFSTDVQGASKLNMDPPKPEPSPGLPRQVVYVPSCVTRMMGPSRSDSETASVHEKLLSLFAKAGYEVIYPEVCALGYLATHRTCPRSAKR